MTHLCFFEQCDRWRTKCENGEADWHEMMANRKPISQEKFIDSVDIKTAPFLDEDETLDDFTADDPQSGYYESTLRGKPLYFVQKAGFEFIFTLSGNSP